MTEEMKGKQTQACVYMCTHTTNREKIMPSKTKWLRKVLSNNGSLEKRVMLRIKK